MPSGGLDDVSDEDDEADGCSDKVKRSFRTQLKRTYLSDAWERLKAVDRDGSLTNGIISAIVTYSKQVQRAPEGAERCEHLLLVPICNDRKSMPCNIRGSCLVMSSALCHSVNLHC